MEIFVVIIIIIIAVVFFVMQGESHENKIKEYIESLGGKVINIEEKHLFTGPFILVGKGRRVYKIEYEINHQIKEGWVKFGNLTGPDWRL